MALRSSLLSVVIASAAAAKTAWPPTDGCPAPWRGPELDETFDVLVSVPNGVVVTNTDRNGDQGYGTDLTIHDGRVDVRVFDDDGDAFFQAKRGNNSCKVDVGSDGQAPGPVVRVYEESGMRCTFFPSTVFKIALHIEDVADGSADCPKDAKLGTEAMWPPTGCPAPWRGPNFDDTFNVSVSVPKGVVVTRTSRNGDHGWGADLTIRQDGVDVNVFDDDGDAFFQVQRGNNLCKVDVGSDGQGPGPVVRVFEERGMRCTFIPAQSHVFKMVLNTEDVLDGSADCPKSAGQISNTVVV